MSCSADGPAQESSVMFSGTSARWFYGFAAGGRAPSGMRSTSVVSIGSSRSSGTGGTSTVVFSSGLSNSFEAGCLPCARASLIASENGRTSPIGFQVAPPNSATSESSGTRLSAIPSSSSSVLTGPTGDWPLLVTHHFMDLKRITEVGVTPTPAPQPRHSERREFLSVGTRRACGDDLLVAVLLNAIQGRCTLVDQGVHITSSSGALRLRRHAQRMRKQLQLRPLRSRRDGSRREHRGHYLE